jgi:thiamine biosynthesis lipoprotein
MKSVFYQILILAALFVGTTQCRSPQKIPANSAEAPALQKYTYQQALMGTRFLMTFYTKDKAQADEAARAAFRFADDVNSACSDYDVTSELMQLNAAPSMKSIPLSDLLSDILHTSLEISTISNGAYDPTLGHHSYNWRMARKKGVLPTADQITKAKAASGWKYLMFVDKRQSITKLTPNMRLDLGGIAKGYAADGMLKVLTQHGITQASITAGGEVRLGDAPPGRDGWKISLHTLDSEHQLSPKIIVLSNCAISTSGDLYQSITIDGTRYSHIVDPDTALGLTTRRSATVIGPDCTHTDALATALCVDPTLQFPKFKTLVILEQPDGTLKRIQSENWPSPTPR